MSTDSMPAVIKIGEIRNLRKTVSDKLQELRQSGFVVFGGQVGGLVVRPITKRDAKNIAFVRSAIQKAKREQLQWVAQVS